MYVVKRDGQKQRFSFDKISKRLDILCKRGPWGDALNVNSDQIALDTIKQLCDNIKTSEIDELSAGIAYGYTLDNPDYGVLASRIIVSNMQTQSDNTFSKFVKKHLSLFDEHIARWILDNSLELDNMIDYSLDYLYDYPGVQKFITSYAWSNIVDGKNVITDLPQYMHLRVAIMLNSNITDNENKRLMSVAKTYLQCSQWYYTHATPTLINSCRKNAQLNSCFLMGVDDDTDSIIRDCLSNCCIISKKGGGIGLHYSNVRATGSLIKTTHGKASGIPSQLTVFDAITHSWNQGGKRNASIAIYIEPWHADIMQVLQLKLSSGDSGIRAKNLFYSIWMCDLFMKRALNYEKWSLFSPDTAPHLNEVYDGMNVCEHCGFCDRLFGITDLQVLGIYSVTVNSCTAHHFVRKNVFTDLYEHYEASGLAIEVIESESLVNLITRSQREVGIPNILFKDKANVYSNQQNIGTIRSSNLCTEIIEYSDAKNYAACTLASVVLPKFVKTYKIGCTYWNQSLPKISDENIDKASAIKLCHELFNFNMLSNTVSHIVKRLNNSLVVSVSPVREVDNILKFAPIGIGLQGLADVFAIIGCGFDCLLAETLDQMIIECIYYSAVIASSKLAKKHGPYNGYAGSPMSRGLLAPDLHGFRHENIIFGDMDKKAREYVSLYGVSNSLMVSLMPTNSTSRLFGNQDMFEPFTSMLYNRQINKGSITVLNTHLVRDLISNGLWNNQVKTRLLESGGNITDVEELPEYFYRVYKNVRELKLSVPIKRARVRQNFVCQSQSLNHYPINNNDIWLRTILFNTWEMGLITGTYYVHTLSSTVAQKIKTKHITETPSVCYLGCESCSA